MQRPKDSGTVPYGHPAKSNAATLLNGDLVITATLFWPAQKLSQSLYY